MFTIIKWKYNLKIKLLSFEKLNKKKFKQVAILKFSMRDRAVSSNIGILILLVTVILIFSVGHFALSSTWVDKKYFQSITYF